LILTIFSGNMGVFSGASYFIVLIAAAFQDHHRRKINVCPGMLQEILVFN